jgi:hypothetical protein
MKRRSRSMSGRTEVKSSKGKLIFTLAIFDDPFPNR